VASPAYDAVVVGAGPNGLAAAVTLARAGRSVLVVEAAETVGGGCRTAALTLPGFAHDVCSAIHPLAAASPYFRDLPLAAHGLEWVEPDVLLAHPLDDGTAGVLHRSVDDTAAGLGADGRPWQRLLGGFVDAWPALLAQFMDPLRLPRRPLALARFGVHALRPARGFARSRFDTPGARALFAGIAAHAFLPLTHPFTAGFGLLLGVTGHAVGWPLPRGGSQAIPDALTGYLSALGGTIQTGWRVRTLDELPPARAVLLDVNPAQLGAMAGDRLPAGYRRRLERFRHGPAAFKVDYALDGPVPWAAEDCRRAGTVHLGGTLEEITATEAAVAAGRVPDRPFTLVAQQSLFDPTRAPSGKHAVWAYCHVPNGCTVDMTDAVTGQIERFAPGFREQILATHVMSPADYEDYNPNYVGGDIGGGAHDGLQLLGRPVLSLNPHRTPLDGVFLCSASTRPGGGVHGACGALAARAALRSALR
jgi:phytoene dehydrogenase-like protein